MGRRCGGTKSIIGRGRLAQHDRKKPAGTPATRPFGGTRRLHIRNFAEDKTAPTEVSSEF